MLCGAATRRLPQLLPLLMTLLMPLLILREARAGEEWKLRVALAPMYDSNAGRVDAAPGAEVRGDFGLRLTWQIDASWHDEARRHLLAGQYTGGIKAFVNERDEDTLINASDLLYSYRAAEKVATGISASVRDSTQRVDNRDFTLGAANGVVDWFALARGALRASAGYQRFTYHPLPEFSYHAMAAGVSWRQALPHDLTFDAGYALQARFFESNAFRLQQIVTGPNPEDGFVQVVRLNVGRRDNTHEFALGLRWVGPFLLRFQNVVIVNGSNSDGESYVRNRSEVVVSADLPAEVYLYLRAQAQFSVFPDRFAISGQTALADDDENQTAVIAVLGRPVFGPLGVELQYGFYRSEFTAAQNRFPYLRHVVSLGFTVTLDSREAQR